MTWQRVEHPATLLNDGHVLIAGGLVTGTTQASAELFVPSDQRSQTGGRGSEPFERLQVIDLDYLVGASKRVWP
jgi:hypothetical protein